MPATYDAMAECMIKSIKDNFSKDVLSRLCGIAADGLYQAAGFRESLLGIEDSDNGQLSLSVTWDAAHHLNLRVVEVKDQSMISDHFKHHSSKWKGLCFSATRRQRRKKTSCLCYAKIC